jgi:SAM-dependent methyltransferase
MKTRRRIDPDLDTLMPILIGIWRRFHKESGPADILQTREFRGVVEAVVALQTGLSNTKSLLVADYFADRQLLGAYMLYHWVVHYQQALSLIGELPDVPRRVLDVCSGPAPMAFAALRHGASEVIAVDRNLTALELGSQVAGRYGHPLTIRQWRCHGTPCPVEGKFDLILIGHCLEELFPATKKGWVQEQEQFIASLLKRLTPHGFLLIVEDSLLEPNRRVLQLRDHFVSQGVPIQAPCVWRGECPALKTKDSPCYAQREFEKPRLIKEIQRAASINLSSLKMSYLIFRSPEAQWPVLPNIPLYRIISPPVETYQGKRYYLCGKEGKKTLGSHLKEHPLASRPFEYLRRGELISVEGALDHGHSLDIVKETKVSVEAACGKPLVEEPNS